MQGGIGELQDVCAQYCLCHRWARLAVVRSLYPAVSLEVVDGGFAEGTEDAEAERLVEEATESAFRLVKDLYIFYDNEQQNQDNWEKM